MSVRAANSPWPVVSCSAEAVVAALLDRDRRLLLFGPPGVGKSTLTAALASHLAARKTACRCISADPGSPAFGLPGCVTLGHWGAERWECQASEALCTLDAGRFRLPLVAGVRRLIRLAEEGVLLVDCPGVVRGVAGRELLWGMVEAAEADGILALTAPGRTPPLAEELRALGIEILVVEAAARAGPSRRRSRARRRTALWDDHLALAPSQRLSPETIDLIGTPPPLDQPAAWAGRQIALLDGVGKTLAMGEVLRLEEDQLMLAVPSVEMEPSTLLVRDAARGPSGLLETAAPFAPEPLTFLPSVDSAPHSEQDGGPPVVGRMGSLDLALVNGVFGDALLHARIRHLGRSLLFDLGDGSRLSARLAHQVTDVFISHAHMDHLGGFQWLMRSRLGEFPPCRLYGPPGLARHIECFINSFLWDRIGSNGPCFEVAELDGARLRRARLQAGIAGRLALDEIGIADGVLLEEADFRVRAVELDHGGTPVLAYALELADTVHVRKDRLATRCLEPVPWLTRLKHALLAGDDGAVITLPDGSAMPAGRLGEDLTLVTPGKTLVYATDLADTPDNRERLQSLARNAHTFFCEAAFRETHAGNARDNGHLTTRAAGEIATAARVARWVPFHFSRRYQDDPRTLYDELKAACDRVHLPSSLPPPEHH